MFLKVSRDICIAALAISWFASTYAFAQIPIPARPSATKAPSGTPKRLDLFAYGYSMMDAGFSQGLGAETLMPGNGFATSFLNPAVLGDSTRSGTAALSLSYAALYPKLNLPDLDETTLEAQYRHAEWGYALRVKRHDFGSTSIDSVRSSSPGDGMGMEYSLSLGRALMAGPRMSHAFGVTLTVAKAPEAFVAKGATGTGYLLDAGYYGSWRKILRFGASLDNVGIPIKGARPEIMRSEYPGYVEVRRSLVSDPDYVLTPLGIHLGARVAENVHAQGIDIVDAGLTAVVSEQFGGTSLHDPQRFWTYAADVEFLKTLRLRAGRLDEEEVTAVNRFAIDLDLFRHLEFGMAVTTADYAFNAGQKSIHVGLYDLLAWGPKDMRWWRD